jgi:VanZ family protein
MQTNYTIAFRFLFWSTLFIVLYLAFTPEEIEITQNIWDKFKHAFAFFVLLSLYFFAYPNSLLSDGVLFLLGVGVFIEIVQLLLPTRDFSLLDILADLVGLFLGRFFLFFARKSLF